MGIAALLREKRQPIDRFICAWAGCDDPAFLCLRSDNQKPRLTTGQSVLRIYSLLKADLDTQIQCQKLWRKDPFGVETSAFAEENLGRANLGNPIEGISKLNSSDIDFTASKIMKPATPTITTANRMVLRSMRKLPERLLKASTIRNRERVKLCN